MADDSPVMDDPVVASALRVLRGYKNSMHPADRAELIFALRDYGDMRRENAELRQGIREIDRKLDRIIGALPGAASSNAHLGLCMHGNNAGACLHCRNLKR